MNDTRWIDRPGVEKVSDERIKKLRAEHRKKFAFLQDKPEDKNEIHNSI